MKRKAKKGIKSKDTDKKKDSSKTKVSSANVPVSANSRNDDALRNKDSSSDKDSITGRYGSSTHRVRIFLVVLLVISLGVLIGTASFTVKQMNEYNSYHDRIISYESINTYVTVVSGALAGLNGDTDALRFGIVSPGGGGTRFLIINPGEKAVLEIYFTGDMAEYLSVQKNRYLVEPGVIEKVAVNLDVPKGTPPGEYNGTVHVVLLKP